MTERASRSSLATFSVLPALLGLTLLTSSGGCSGSKQVDTPSANVSGSDGTGAAAGPSAPQGSGNGGSGGSGGSVEQGPDLSLGGTATTTPEGLGGGAACVATKSATTLEPIYLTFAFDVSGSMGDDDPDYGDDHSSALKWDPVVSATASFFGDPTSSGIHASLTFFPIDADKDERCDPDSYAEPDVALSELPSAAFATALDKVKPDRGGTPTLAVITGVIASTESVRQQHPNAKHALVLVSDGEPQSCKDNQISSIESAVAAVKGSLPTYVIGVANPSGDANVKALDSIAKAGGTEQAFIVATGDPAATKTAFAKAVDSIRHTSVSCSVALPEPPDGKKLNPREVNVTYTAAQEVQLIYDPSCMKPDAWHYDDPTKPSSVELCPGSCDAVQLSNSAMLSVEFGCATLTKPPK